LEKMRTSLQKDLREPETEEIRVAIEDLHEEIREAVFHAEDHQEAAVEDFQEADHVEILAEAVRAEEVVRVLQVREDFPEEEAQADQDDHQQQQVLLTKAAREMSGDPNPYLSFRA
jgi:hypothetical protein